LHGYWEIIPIIGRHLSWFFLAIFFVFFYDNNIPRSL